MTIDQNKSFDEQSEEAKQEIIDLTNSQTPYNVVSEMAGYFPRPLKELFNIEGIEIVKIYAYVYPREHEENGLIASIQYKL